MCMNINKMPTALFRKTITLATSLTWFTKACWHWTSGSLVLVGKNLQRRPPWYFDLSSCDLIAINWDKKKHDDSIALIRKVFPNFTLLSLESCKCKTFWLRICSGYRVWTDSSVSFWYTSIVIQFDQIE